MPMMIPPLAGQAVQDDRQLDGSRHLTVDLVDPLGSWLCSLHCILEAEGTLREADLELETPDGPWSGGLDRVERLTLEGPLRLIAVFEDAGFRVLIDLLEDEEDGGYRGVLEPDAV